MDKSISARKPAPPTKMQFFQAWKLKGFPNPARTTWSAEVDGRLVFTAWHNPFGASEVVFDPATRRTVYRCEPGEWATEAEGRRYIERARKSMDSGVPGELILLTGTRDTTPSKVDFASFDERFWFIRFTRVDDEGTMHGDLLPRLADDARSPEST